MNLSEIQRNPANSFYHCRTLTPSVMDFGGFAGGNSGYMEKLIEENSLLNRELTSVLRELKAETSRKNDNEVDIKEELGKLAKKVEEGGGRKGGREVGGGGRRGGGKREEEGRREEGGRKEGGRRRGGGVEDEGEVKSCNSSFMVTKTMKTLNGDR